MLDLVFDLTRFSGCRRLIERCLRCTTVLALATLHEERLVAIETLGAVKSSLNGPRGDSLDDKGFHYLTPSIDGLSLPPDVLRKPPVAQFTGVLVRHGRIDVALEPEPYGRSLVDGVAGQDLHDVLGVLPLPSDDDGLFLGGDMPLCPEVSEFFLSHCVEVWGVHARYYVPGCQVSTGFLHLSSPSRSMAICLLLLGTMASEMSCWALGRLRMLL